MARNFADASDRIQATTGAMPQSAGTIALSLYPTWAWNDGADHHFFHVQTDSSNLLQLRKFSDNSFYCGWFVGGVSFRVATAASGLVQNSWNRLILTWDDTANEVKFYLNGAQAGSTVTSLQTVSTTSDAEIGNGTGANVSAAGLLAEVAIWAAVLPAAQRAIYDAGYSPAAMAKGRHYWPLVRGLQDVWSGATGTSSGTDVAEHPRILYPARRRSIFVPAAAVGGGGTVRHPSLMLLGVGA